MLIKDKIAVIAGAVSGIRLAIASLYHRVHQSCDVDQHEVAVSAAVQRIVCIAGNVVDETACVAMSELVVAELAL